MWKKTKPSILATATKLKCTWKLPSPPLLFPSISTKLSTNFLRTHQPIPRSFSSSLRRKASSESLASLLQESGMMMHFSEARGEERRGKEKGKLRLLWASGVVFLARKRKRRRSVREYRAHFEPSTSPSSLFFYFTFWLRVSKWLEIWFFSCFLSPHFYSFFFGNIDRFLYWVLARMRFFLCAEIWQLGGFFPGNVKTHTKIVIFRDLLPFFEI